MTRKEAEQKVAEERRTGGPAFPIPGESFKGPDGNITFPFHAGLTLRDYFAAKAMQGLIANYVSTRADYPASVADAAYGRGRGMDCFKGYTRQYVLSGQRKRAFVGCPETGYTSIAIGIEGGEEPCVQSFMRDGKLWSVMVLSNEAVLKIAECVVDLTKEIMASQSLPQPLWAWWTRREG